MASFPITSWQKDGETIETVTDFISLGSKITADGDCSHEIKRFFFPLKEKLSPTQIIKNQRHYSADKCLYSQSYGFSSSHVWMWELDHKERRAPKSWCFWNVVLEKTLEILWTARRANQSVLKEISPEYSLEGLILNLKLQYFGHLMQRTDSLERLWCWERLKAGREGDDRGLDGWMTSATLWTWVWASSRSWWWTGKPGALQSMGLQRVKYNWLTKLNWWC